jgi:hypothetical protein
MSQGRSSDAESDIPDANFAYCPSRGAEIRMGGVAADARRGTGIRDNDVAADEARGEAEAAPRVTYSERLACVSCQLAR